MADNLNSGYGQALVHAAYTACPSFGKIFVVCPSTDGNYDKLTRIFRNDNSGVARLFTTLEAAYAQCTSNNNDVILLDGHTAHTLTAPILWAKNRIHVIGMDGGERLVDQGSKVQNLAADTVAYVIKVTGIRNTFRNIKFIQASTTATGLTVVADSGEGTLYKNCSFIFGTATNFGLTTATEFTAGCDSATFLDCTFGSDTLLTTAARQVMLFKTDVTEPKSNVFRGCNFIISSSSATASNTTIIPAPPTPLASFSSRSQPKPMATPMAWPTAQAQPLWPTS